MSLVGRMHIKNPKQITDIHMPGCLFVRKCGPPVDGFVFIAFISIPIDVMMLYDVVVVVFGCLWLTSIRFY